MSDGALTGFGKQPIGRGASIFDLSALPRSAVFASLASNILNLALPLVVLQIYDRIIPNQALETLIVLVSAVVAVIALDALLKLARSYLLGWLSAERAAGASIRAATVVAGAPWNGLERSSLPFISIMVVSFV